MSFALHPQLEKDTILIGDLPLCRVLLMNNIHFPWLILVPLRQSARELFDLEPYDYKLMMDEVRAVATRFSELTDAFKMNIAALGNMVPQLHIHIIARFEDDMAWPKPVWNAGITPEPYPAARAAHVAEQIRANLGL